jgi:hypothetical protein
MRLLRTTLKALLQRSANRTQSASI